MEYMLALPANAPSLLNPCDIHSINNTQQDVLKALGLLGGLFAGGNLLRQHNYHLAFVKGVVQVVALNTDVYRGIQPDPEWGKFHAIIAKHTITRYVFLHKAFSAMSLKPPPTTKSSYKISELAHDGIILF